MNSLPIPRSRKGMVGCIGLIFLMLGLCGIGTPFLRGFGVQSVLGQQEPEISLAAEKIPLPFAVPLFGHEVPNTLPATWLTMLVLLGISALATRKMEMVPSGLQNGVEAIIEMFYGFLENVAGQKTRAFFPLVATFFFFILTSNWMGILPGFGSVGVWEEHHGERVLIPFLRSANADLSTTLALALISVVAAQYFGFKMVGRSYLTRYFRFNRLIAPFARLRGRKRPSGRSELIQFFLDFLIGLLSGVVEVIVGFLELVMEMIKILPFSVRLFGNIFAGEVLLIVISFLFTFVVSLPFMGLELFVGLIQALIFTMLSTIFFIMATMGHGPEESR